ncbi:hypothetical protein [Anaerococcus rubeinfantis]|uniref:hypothetical protein n=1 Tax=Anaerococcus rubeinfantis TaxID=1720199 RepID=UPI00073E6ED2|nr:hypothetical protein [Anaerococcus rubeinfantis]
MKKKISLVFALTFLLSSCGGSMVKVNQSEIAQNEAKLEEKNKKKEIEKLEESNDKTNEDKKEKSKKKTKKKIKLDNEDSDKKSKDKSSEEKNSKNKDKEIKRVYPDDKKEESKNLSPAQNSKNSSSKNESYLSFRNSDTSDKSGNYPELLKDLSGKKFRFSSEAGGWQTVLTFSDNGYFTAKYEDYDYDSVAICEFNGKFSVDSKVNDTAYIFRLDKADITSPVNTEEVKNIGGKNMTVRYVDLPYGFAVNNDSDHSFQGKFSLYLPLRKRSEMSAEVNEWLDISGEKNVEKDITRIYLLINNKTIDTFREQVN